MPPSSVDSIGISFLTDPNRYVASTTLAWFVTVFSFSYYFRSLGLVCYFLYCCDSVASLVALNFDLFVYRLTLSYSMRNFPFECIFCYCFRLNYCLPSFPNHSHLVAFYCVSIPMVFSFTVLVGLAAIHSAICLCLFCISCNNIIIVLIAGGWVLNRTEFPPCTDKHHANSRRIPGRRFEGREATT